MNEPKPDRTSAAEYQNNPFLLALDGIRTLFTLAKSVAILFLIFSIINITSYFIGPNSSPDPAVADRESDELVKAVGTIGPDTWILIGAISLIAAIGLFVIGCIINGISDVTAARIAKGQRINLKTALAETMKRFGGYLWLRIIVAVKTFLWSLLLVIPGIVMSYRYTLAGAAFFGENTKSNDAVKRSLALTKGAWLTTYASYTLFNVITLGLIAPLLNPGITGLLYRQFAASPDKKPAAHVLSWLTLIIPIALVILVILAIFVVAATLSAPTAP